MKNVELNIPLLDAEIKAHRMKQGEFSELIGKSRSYLSYVKSTGSKIPKNVESLICKMLDKPDGYFVKSPEQPSGGASREAKILENIASKLDKIQSEIEEIKEAQDKIWSKVHANTIQMERLKDMWK